MERKSSLEVKATACINDPRSGTVTGKRITMNFHEREASVLEPSVFIEACKVLGLDADKMGLQYYIEDQDYGGIGCIYTGEDIDGRETRLTLIGNEVLWDHSLCDT